MLIALFPGLLLTLHPIPIPLTSCADLYTGDNPPPTPVADRLFLSFPIAVTRSLQHEVMKTKTSIDECVSSILSHESFDSFQYTARDLLLGLRQKGFLLPEKDDNFFERLMIRRGKFEQSMPWCESSEHSLGKYYVDQGCSSLIINGEVRVHAQSIRKS